MKSRGSSPLLPHVDKSYALIHPSDVRVMPKGGYCWRCEKPKRKGSEGRCNFIAVSFNKAGQKVCKRHGGVTHAQVNSRLRAQKEAKGIKVGKPVGRPRKSGFYRIPDVLYVDDRVEQWKLEGLEPDNTDEDMLYLRAYLVALKELYPGVDSVHPLLLDLSQKLKSILDEPEQIESMDQLVSVQALLISTLEAYKVFLGITDALEARHARLIKLAKVRVETRLMNKEASDTRAFGTLLKAFDNALSEIIDGATYRAFKVRLKRDFEAITKAEVIPLAYTSA